MTQAHLKLAAKLSEKGIHLFADGRELRQGLKHWIDYYNSKRPHSSLDSRTPDEAYWQLPLPGYAGERELVLVA